MHPQKAHELIMDKIRAIAGAWWYTLVPLTELQSIQCGHLNGLNDVAIADWKANKQVSRVTLHQIESCA